VLKYHCYSSVVSVFGGYVVTSEWVEYLSKRGRGDSGFEKST